MRTIAILKKSDHFVDQNHGVSSSGLSKFKILTWAGVLVVLAQVSCQRFGSGKRTSADVSFIRSVVDRISEAELHASILDLQKFETRYDASEGNKAAGVYIMEKLKSLGLPEVSFDEFSYYNELTGSFEAARNVVASQKGLQTPEKIIVLGAHFDSISRHAPDGRISALDKENPAPGADDNATGVAALLAAARVLSSLETSLTIRFCAFSAEEGGIHGGAHYAAECARKNEDIIAMINLDMIGYADQEPEDIDIFSNTKSEWLLNHIVNIAPVYAPGLPVYRRVDDSYDGSDHGPFWNNGYPAVCFMEDYYPSSRLYHGPSDTAETINTHFALRCTRLAAAAVAELAGIHGDGGAAAASAGAASGPISQAVNWEEDAGKKFLVAISPSADRADIIDVTFPHVHSKESLLLETVPAETWALPDYHPVALSRLGPQGAFLVSMIRLRALGREGGEGLIKVFDLKHAAVDRSLKVGRHPMAGCAEAIGKEFYLPYWGEKHIDVFDTKSFKLVGQIPVPVPLSKLVIDEEGKVGLGISPQAGSILVISLPDKKVTRVFGQISVPNDIVIIDDRFALACSSDKETLLSIDLRENRISAVASLAPRPARLKLSPQKDGVICIHRLSDRATLFRIDVEDGKLLVEKTRELDLGGIIADGTFGADSSTAYFADTDQARLIGVDLATGKIFWGMRMGGVRARGDVELLDFYSSIIPAQGE